MHRFKDFEQKKKDFYRFGWGVKVYLLNLFLLDITTAFLASCFSGKLLICRVVKQDFIGKETGIVLSEYRYSTVRVSSSLVCHGRGNFSSRS
jgi:hypothetical protein